MSLFLVVLAWIVGTIILLGLTFGVIGGLFLIFSDGEPLFGAILAVVSIVLMAALVTFGINTGAFGSNDEHCRTGTVYKSEKRGKHTEWWCEAR